MADKIYYDYSKIDGYDCPIKIVVSRRGLGKTFGKIRKCTERYITNRRRFIYVVETGEMVKELARNKGEKFWSALLKYYSEQDTSRKRYFYEKLTNTEVEDEQDETKSNTKSNLSLFGGTIKINGETAGYIIDLNAFGELKRNNFIDVETVIFDEFISEKTDKTTLENPKKISSIIQSVARLKNIRIYMLGNSVRLSDSMLARMGFKLEKYGFHKKYDKHGLLAVLHFVDPKDYPEFAEAYEESVAGRFASFLGETHEEENIFIENVPESRMLKEFKYKKGGLSLNIVRENIIISLRELANGCMACVPFSGRNAKTLYCLTEKEQGYILGYHIICNTKLKQYLMNLLRADIVYYYSELEYEQLKLIIKGER